MPPETQAELVGGIVYMPSPMRRDHGRESRFVAGWLDRYERFTPGVEGADGATVKLDLQGEPQPDHFLLIVPECGGQSGVDADGYFTGAPRLVLEVASVHPPLRLESARRPITNARECRSTWSSSSIQIGFTGSSAAATDLRKCGPGEMGSIARRSSRACGSMPRRSSAETGPGATRSWSKASRLRRTRPSWPGWPGPREEVAPMSTVRRPPTKTLPPLVAGQHLDQPTFHQRYEAMPPETRAELVDGVVYMPSPLIYDHGEEDCNVGGWLFHYKVFTRGVHSPINATVKLDRKGEPQPDCQLFIPAELGGQVHIDEERYITGAPS